MLIFYRFLATSNRLLTWSGANAIALVPYGLKKMFIFERKIVFFCQLFPPHCLFKNNKRSEYSYVGVADFFVFFRPFVFAVWPVIS